MAGTWTEGEIPPALSCTTVLSCHPSFSDSAWAEENCNHKKRVNLKGLNSPLLKLVDTSQPSAPTRGTLSWELPSHLSEELCFPEDFSLMSKASNSKSIATF